MTVGYKIVAFGNELYCASVLIFPLLFPFSDALAEIYGPGIAKNMIWYTAICELVFVSLTNMAIHLPSPANWHHQAEYDFLVGGYFHILIANVTAMIVSFYINVNLVSRWKILTRGKYYYLRSVGATAIGEITYTIITNIIAYTNTLPVTDIINIIVSDYFFKLLYSAIIAYPAALLVTHVKMKYGKSSYSDSFNPFQQRHFRKIVDFATYSSQSNNFENSRFDKSSN